MLEKTIPNQGVSDLERLSAVFEKKDNKDNVFFSDVNYSIRRYKYLILLISIIFGFLGWYNTAKKPILYRSSLTLINEPDIGSSTNNNSRFTLYLTQHYYKTQFEILASRTLAEKIAKQMLETGLHPPKAGINRLNNSKLYKGWLEFKKLFKSYLTKQQTEINSSNKPEERINNISSTDQYSELLNKYTNTVKSGLRSSGGKDSQLMTLSFISSDAKFSADVLNLIADVFIDYISISKQKANQSTGQWLVDRLESAKDAVLESEKKLLEFQRDNELTDSDVIENRNSTIALDLKRKLVDARARYTESLATYGSKHPEVKKAAREMNSLNRTLISASGLNLKQKNLIFELAKFENELSTNTELYQTYLTQFNGFSLTDTQTSNNIQILDNAKISVAPVSSQLSRAIFIWALLGSFFGGLVAFGITMLDQTFVKPGDVEEKLKITVLGQLPFISKSIVSKDFEDKSKIKDFIPETFYLTDTKTPFAEAVNHIRTNTQFSNVDKQPQSILITSSIQSEGKTTLSSNLALALSRIDETLLIEADFRKPRIIKVFGDNKEDLKHFGLVDHLAGLCSFEESTYFHVGNENLTVMPAGTIPPNPQELLASRQFNQFLANVKSYFRYIVIDTAPILPVSDALVLGKLVDAVLVVIKANSTNVKLVREAIKRLEIAHIKPTGVVLTQLTKESQQYYGNDADYYQYSYR